MIDQPTRATRQLSRAAVNLENIFTLYKMGEMVEMVESHFKPIVYCDKMIAACKRFDQPLQRNTIFVTLNMTNKTLNPFDMNRTEYASLLGITPNAVRMRLRQGKLEGEYIFENGKYFFRAPLPLRGSIDIPLVNQTTPKKKYRRGNHYKANYPNEAFRKHNEAKMLAKLKHNVDDEVQELLPEAIEIAKQKKIDRVNAALPPAASSLSSLSQAASPLSREASTKNYGTGIFNESSKGYYDNINPLSHRLFPNKFTATNRGRRINKKGPYEI